MEITADGASQSVQQFTQTPTGSAISLIGSILVIVALWRIFTKAGEQGWKGIIPLLNLYVLYKICWKGWIAILQILLVIADIVLISVSFVSAVAYNGSFTYNGEVYKVTTSADPETLQALAGVLGVSLLIFLVVLLAIFIIDIVHKVKLAHAFDQGAGFAVGLVLFPTIFKLILAFGPAQYIGNPSDPHIGRHSA